MDSSSLIQSLPKAELRGYVKRTLEENKQLKDTIISITEGQRKGACSDCHGKDERIESLKAMSESKDTLNAELLRMCSSLTTNVDVLNEEMKEIKNEVQQIRESTVELKEGVNNNKNEMFKLLEELNRNMAEIKNEVQHSHASSRELDLNLGIDIMNARNELNETVNKINENITELKDLEVRLILRLKDGVDNSAIEKSVASLEEVDFFVDTEHGPLPDQDDMEGDVITAATPTPNKRTNETASSGVTGPTYGVLNGSSKKDVTATSAFSYVGKKRKKKKKGISSGPPRILSDVSGASCFGHSSLSNVKKLEVEKYENEEELTSDDKLSISSDIDDPWSEYDIFAENIHLKKQKKKMRK